MSTFASLKNIDFPKYTVIRILDAIGIDIDSDDGHLYYPEDPTVSIDINDRILRVDMGRPNKRINYTVFAPFNRVDHAQFLMTLLLHSQIISNFIEDSEALEAGFSLKAELNLTDDDCNVMDIPTTTVSIVDANEELHAEGTHVDESIATMIAVLEYGISSKWIAKEIAKSIENDVVASWEELQRISELKRSESRALNNLKKSYLAEPGGEDDENVQTDFEDLALPDISEDDEDDEEMYLADKGEDEISDFTEDDFGEYGSALIWDEAEFNINDNDPKFIEYLESHWDAGEDEEEAVAEDSGSSSIEVQEAEEVSELDSVLAKRTYGYEESNLAQDRMLPAVPEAVPMMNNGTMGDPYGMQYGMHQMSPNFQPNRIPQYNQYSNQMNAMGGNMMGGYPVNTFQYGFQPQAQRGAYAGYNTGDGGFTGLPTQNAQMMNFPRNSFRDGRYITPMSSVILSNGF